MNIFIRSLLLLFLRSHFHINSSTSFRSTFQSLFYLLLLPSCLFFPLPFIYSSLLFLSTLSSFFPYSFQFFNSLVFFLAQGDITGQILNVWDLPRILHSSILFSILHILSPTHSPCLPLSLPLILLLIIPPVSPSYSGIHQVYSRHTIEE